MIHLTQVGLVGELKQSVDPWLCYYCGECSETCPRNAEPGETMMATRRYLTASYDWTGLSKKFYLSKTWEIGAISLVSLWVILLFVFFHGPIVTDHVALNTFAPVHWVEMGDLIMAAVLSFFLLTNAFRMSLFINSSDEDLKIPFLSYFTQIPIFLSNLVTQKRWRDCSENKTRWLKHFLLVSGYGTMLILIVVFLRWFQTDTVHPIYHPQRLLGYYATIVLLYFTVDFMLSRVKKNEQIHKFSHMSDWIFLVLSMYRGEHIYCILP